MHKLKKQKGILICRHYCITLLYLDTLWIHNRILIGSAVCLFRLPFCLSSPDRCFQSYYQNTFKVQTHTRVHTRMHTHTHTHTHTGVLGSRQPPWQRAVGGKVCHMPCSYICTLKKMPCAVSRSLVGGHTC